jgi:hypothetical protein
MFMFSCNFKLVLMRFGIILMFVPIKLMILFSVCRRWFEVFCFYIASLAIISQMELALIISDMLVKDNLNY